jgi:hypothetical protein
MIFGLFSWAQRQEINMADNDDVNERAMVEEDKRTLKHALDKVRAKKKKNAGDRQIEQQLEQMVGSADLADPQRYHGS